MLARNAFMAALYSMMPLALLSAFVSRNMVPMVIWVIATFAVVFAASRRKCA